MTGVGGGESIFNGVLEEFMAKNYFAHKYQKLIFFLFFRLKIKISTPLFRVTEFCHFEGLLCSVVFLSLFGILEECCFFLDRTDIMYIIIEEGESIWERYCQLKNSKNSIFDYRSIGTQRNL